jgi:hypothetical protein
VLGKPEMKPSTEIKHKPIKYFVAEKRIELKTEVEDKAGVHLVRCYFRAVEQADYVFIAMKPGSSLYKGILPAPSKETDILEYLFLAVNGNNQVVKTQTFKVERKEKDKVPPWQEVGSEGDIHVTTELAEAPEAPAGFADSIAMDVAESSARFGFVVGGLYTASQAAAAGGATGTAAGATSAGTVSASTGGLSTMGYVGIGAAVVAGGAAIGGGGGGGNGDHSTTTYLTTSTTTYEPEPTTTSTTTSSTTTVRTTTTSTTTIAPQCAPPSSWELHLVPDCSVTPMPGSCLDYIVTVDVKTPNKQVFYRYSSGVYVQPQRGEGYQNSGPDGRISLEFDICPDWGPDYWDPVRVYVEIADCEGQPSREWMLYWPDDFPLCYY